MSEKIFDEKANASLTLGDVVRQTAHNFPDSRFHPQVYAQTQFYTISGIRAGEYAFSANSDGLGTKLEFSERLYAKSILDGKPDPEVFTDRAFDLMAMIESDAARWGMYLPAITNTIDFNTASDVRVVSAIAKGLKNAADAGQFAVINGETAELGYRTSGYGDVHINWNASANPLANPDKLFLGKELAPGQPVVAVRETSIRSNGLTMARAILEADYMVQQGLSGKKEYVERELTRQGVVLGDKDIIGILTTIFGHDALEQVLPPWHELQPEVTKQLSMPSKLYSPLIYSAQGKIDEPKNVDIIAAAHISGGGIPEKAKRMLQTKRLGVSIDSVFPEPSGIQSLVEIYNALPDFAKEGLKLNDRIASEQWNRGIGFLIVTKNMEEAKKLIDLGTAKDYQLAIAGKIIDKSEVQFRGHTWQYSP